MKNNRVMIGADSKALTHSKADLGKEEAKTEEVKVAKARGVSAKDRGPAQQALPDKMPRHLQHRSPGSRRGNVTTAGRWDTYRRSAHIRADPQAQREASPTARRDRRDRHLILRPLGHGVCFALCMRGLYVIQIMYILIL